MEMKICRECGKIKLLSEYSFKIKKKGICHTICKSCQREYAKEHYNKNKNTYKKRAIKSTKIYRKRNLSFVFNYLQAHPCIDCGESDVAVLEFDHIKGIKDYEVAMMPWRGYSLKKIKEEINKCEVRCANCHKRRHVKEGNGWRHQFLYSRTYMGTVA